MTKREYGTGTIAKKGKKLQPRERLPDGRRPSLGVFASVEEAEGVIAAFRERQGIRATAMTLAEWGPRVLERREKAGHKNSDNDRSRWERYIAKWSLAGEPMELITEADVDAFARELLRRKAVKATTFGRGPTKRVVLTELDRTISRQTAKHVMNLLRVVLHAAKRERYITVNPADDVELEGRDETTEEAWTYLSLDEIALVTGDKVEKRPRSIFAFAIFSGLREGELFGLHWEDVVGLDTKKPEVIVRHSWRGTTKAGRVRRLPLLPMAARVLREIAPLEADRVGPVWPSDDGQPHREGYDAGWADKPWVQQTKKGPVRKVAKGWKRRVGITRDVRFHDLRHTCASHLVSGSWGRAWRLEEVQEYLGHDDIETTRRYAHLMPEALHAAARATRWTPNGRRVADLVADIRRIQQDSNLRPSAPEDFATPNDGEGLEQSASGRRPVGELATSLLLAAASGKPIARADAHELATSVVLSPPVALAVDVLEADDDTFVRALVGLCTAVIETSAAHSTASGAS